MSRLAALLSAMGATALAGLGVGPWFGREPALDSWFSLQWPRTLDADAVTAMLRHFAASPRPRLICFEVQAHQGRLTYRLGVPQRDAQVASEAVTAFLPGVLLTPLTGVRRLRLTRAIELRLSTRQRSLRTDAALEIAQSAITALGTLGADVIVQTIVGPRLAPQHVGSHSEVRPSSTLRWLASAVTAGTDQLDARQRTELRDKISERGFRVSCRIATPVANRSAARALLRSVLGALRVAEGPGAHLLARSTNPTSVTKARPGRRWPMAVNVAELAGLLTWPLGDAELPGVERSLARRLPIPSAVPSKGRVIGEGTDPRTRRSLALSARDAVMHTAVLGPTGSGKSTVLASLALADIAAGRGVVVVEPKGDLVEELLARIPTSRIDDVVVLDPSDDEAPVGLNPLSTQPRDLAVDHLLAVFRGLYGAYLGPRTTDVLHAALLTLSQQPSANLCALPLLLADERYRRTIVGGLHGDLALGPFWQWYEALSAAERGTVIAPVMNKVRPFLLRKPLRRIIGQARPRFEIAEVFTKRKILLVPLGKGLIGSEAAGLLGSLVVAQLWQAAQRRARIAPERRHPVFCYIDEFQDYLHLPTDLADVLAQARGLGLGQVLAHQHLAQLTPNVRAAVMANARSKVCFRLSADDAKTFAQTTALLDAEDFQSLGRYEIYASLVADGAAQAYCSGVTRPLPPSNGSGARIRQRSRERSGRPTAEVEAELAALVSGTAAEGPIGRRPRSAS